MYVGRANASGLAAHMEIESISHGRQPRCDASRIMGQGARRACRRARAIRNLESVTSRASRASPLECEVERTRRAVGSRNREQEAGVAPASAAPDKHQQSARRAGKVAPTQMRLRASRGPAVRRHLFDAMDRTCTDHSPRGSSPTTGIAKEERPPGRSRGNRILARAGMSRGGAPARTAKSNAVPPRGFEPQPTSFAALCPVLGTVAETTSTSSQWRESNPTFVRA